MPVCLLVWRGLIVGVVAAVPGGACGWLPARAAALAGCGAVDVLVALPPSDFRMILSAEPRCGGQRGRRSGCVLLGMDADGAWLLLVLPCWTRYNVN